MPAPETVSEAPIQPIGERTIGRIPVRNLWLLMLYATDLVRFARNAHVNLEEDLDELPDLVAELLSATVERRLRRNLTPGYRRRSDVLTRVRGRIDILRTASRRLLERGRVACHFDQLTTDTPRNRMVRSALETIARIVRRPDLRHRCRSLASDFALLGVSAARPTEIELVTDRFGRHDADDRTMVRLAQLACDLALPTEDVGIDPLYVPSREITWVRRLYERAVFGFYSVVLDGRGWTVRGGQTLRWPVEAATDAVSEILPNMRTDIILDYRSTGRRIVIDTKFNAIVTEGWYRDETLRSGYLYQMYAYLRSQEGNAASDAAEGLLLHPSVGGHIVDEGIRLQGHLIRFSTVDLSASPATIRERLLAVVDRSIILSALPQYALDAVNQ